MLENKYQARDILFSDLEKKGEQKLKKRIKNKKKNRNPTGKHIHGLDNRIIRIIIRFIMSKHSSNK